MTNDLISRQAAIDALREEVEWEYDWNDEQMYYIEADMAIGAIERLPSAQPERKKGEWIDYTEDGYVECPFCHSATNCDGNKDELHFCFSCGADLKGEDNEND